MIDFSLNECRNALFEFPMCDALLTDQVGCVFVSRISRVVKRILCKPKSLEALLHHFGKCAHHPAWFIIFALLALFYVCIIFLFPILPIFRTCDITYTVLDSNNNLTKSCVRIFSRQSSRFGCLHIFLLPLN